MRKSESREEGRGEREEGGRQERGKRGKGSELEVSERFSGAFPKERPVRSLFPLPSSLFPLLLLCACAVGSPKASMSPAPAAREPMGEADRSMVDESLPPEEQIAQLEGLIDGNLGEIGLAPLATLETLSLDTTSGTPLTLNGKETRPEPVKDGLASKGGEDKDAEKGKKKPPSKEEEEERCIKVCQVIDSICDASERICQIAERMPEGSDAPARCARAQNACRQARAQGESCGCST